MGLYTGVQIWTWFHSYLLSHLVGSSPYYGPRQLQTYILLVSLSAQLRASGSGYDWSKWSHMPILEPVIDARGGGGNMLMVKTWIHIYFRMWSGPVSL